MFVRFNLAREITLSRPAIVTPLSVQEIILKPGKFAWQFWADWRIKAAAFGMLLHFKIYSMLKTQTEYNSYWNKHINPGWGILKLSYMSTLEVVCSFFFFYTELIKTGEQAFMTNYSSDCLRPLRVINISACLRSSS